MGFAAAAVAIFACLGLAKWGLYGLSDLHPPYCGGNGEVSALQQAKPRHQPLQSNGCGPITQTLVRGVLDDDAFSSPTPDRIIHSNWDDDNNNLVLDIWGNGFKLWSAPDKQNLILPGTDADGNSVFFYDRTASPSLSRIR